MTLVEMLRHAADRVECEREAFQSGPSLVMLLRDAADALDVRVEVGVGVRRCHGATEPE